MLLTQLLKEKQAGKPVAQLLAKIEDGEKQPQRACSTSDAVLKELRAKPYLIYPEDYHVRCQVCEQYIVPMDRVGPLIACKCEAKMAIEQPAKGKQWVRFHNCHDLVEMEEDASPQRCPQCGQAHRRSDGTLYSAVCAVKPTKPEKHEELKMRNRILDEITKEPWFFFPEKFKVNCIWGPCGEKNVTFFPRTPPETNGFVCPVCKRLNPVRSYDGEKWIYYEPCGHLFSVPSTGSVSKFCKLCNTERIHHNSDLAKPQWLIPSTTDVANTA